MKKQIFWISLAPVAALSLVLGLWGGSDSRELLSFPFVPLAGLLRQLSLSGGAGNAAAWALFLALSLWPLVWLALRLLKKQAGPEDFVLPVLSGTLLTAFYQMINPGELLKTFGSAAGLGKPLLSMAVWTTLCCYLTLRLRRTALEGRPKTLSRWLPGLTWVMAAVIAAQLFGVEIPAFVRRWQAGNFFALITLLAAAVPAVFSARTARAAGELLSALAHGQYSQQAVEAAGNLSGACGAALAVTAVTQLLYNLMQVLGASVIGDVNLSLNLPVFQLVFLLAALLLSRLLVHGQQLQQDNDLFI